MERGLAVWEGDWFETGELLRKRKRERNHWGADQLLFESVVGRLRSGIRSEIVDYGAGFRRGSKTRCSPRNDTSSCRLYCSGICNVTRRTPCGTQRE